MKTHVGHDQVFVSTHSPMFLDKSQDRCVWLLRLDDLETSIQRVESPEDVRLMLAELGVVPSDVFLKDLVVFVEGSTEELAVFPIWAKTLGFPLTDSPQVGLLSIGGDGQAEKYLRVWLKLMQHAPADFLVVLDKHAGPIAKRLEKDLGIASGKIRILSKHGIEDFYPPKLVVEALRTLFQEDVEPKELPKENVGSFLNERLAVKRIQGWKVQLGTYIASRMDKKEIPTEIHSLIGDIQTLIG